MSANIQILVSGNTKKSIHDMLLNKIEEYDVGLWTIETPKNDMEKEKSGLCLFWDSLNTCQLNIEYSGPVVREFAKAVADEIIKRFPCKKAGWDTVGYVKGGTKEFLSYPPFGSEIKKSTRWLKEVSKDLMPAYEREIAEMKKLQKVFKKSAKQLFGV